MGQKVNPIGLRLGINRTWDSRWYAEGGEYSKMLHEDIHIRKVLRERLAQAGVAKVEARLALDHLGVLAGVTGIPLVLHGGSGIRQQDLRAAMKGGIAKVNVGTEIRQAYDLPDVFGVSNYLCFILPSKIAFILVNTPELGRVDDTYPLKFFHLQQMSVRSNQIVRTAGHC